jgi:curved DNA-binding protein
VEFKDYYSVLGVPRDASADQIKKSFRKLARQYHPDVSTEPDAQTRMSEVNEAYAVLSDAQRRAAYDAVGQGRRQGEPFTPPPNWNTGDEFSGAGFGRTRNGEFSDFFSQLFGRSAPGPGPRRGARPSTGGQARGEDHHAKILLDLGDSWSGPTRSVTLRSPTVDHNGRTTLHDRTLDVKIPVGVRPGQRIRLAGQGSPSLGSGGPGDLLLEIEFRAHPSFELEGQVLVADLPVAPWEAGLGAVVPITLPDRSALKVRVPAGAQSGQRLTVRGKGLPGNPPGDLELQVRVVLPDANDPRVKAHYEAMARELTDFDARQWASRAGR